MKTKVQMYIPLRLNWIMCVWVDSVHSIAMNWHVFVAVPEAGVWSEVPMSILSLVSLPPEHSPPDRSQTSYSHYLCANPCSYTMRRKAHPEWNIVSYSVLLLLLLRRLTCVCRSMEFDIVLIHTQMYTDWIDSRSLTHTCTRDCSSFFIYTNK